MSECTSVNERLFVQLLVAAAGHVYKRDCIPAMQSHPLPSLDHTCTAQGNTCVITGMFVCTQPTCCFMWTQSNITCTHIYIRISYIFNFNQLLAGPVAVSIGTVEIESTVCCMRVSASVPSRIVHRKYFRLVSTAVPYGGNLPRFVCNKALHLRFANSHSFRFSSSRMLPVS